MTKALVCVMNSQENQKSYVQKLFGDPDDYAYKFANETFADKLPIFQNRIHWKTYNYLLAVTIDYNLQMGFFVNRFFGRVSYGEFIYNNYTYTIYFPFIPGTKQVTKTNNYYQIGNVLECIFVESYTSYCLLRREDSVHDTAKLRLLYCTVCASGL